jgi:hypothetical protein
MTIADELMKAQLALWQAETRRIEASMFSEVSRLAVDVLNDKHAGANRDIDKAVAEALEIYRKVGAAMSTPGFWGTPIAPTGGGGGGPIIKP